MKRKPLIILAALVVIAALGGIGFVKLRKPAGPAAAPKVVEVSSKPVQLDEFLVNLADVDQAHYLKATLVLMVKDAPGTDDKIAKDTPQIRDTIITAISRKHFNDLLTTGGKVSLKDAIRAEVNHVLQDKMVTEVYFTSFAMQ